jgi:hypothetical protein
MAVEFSDVDSSSVSAGGVTIANLPQVREISDGLHWPHRGSVGFLRAALWLFLYLIDVQLNIKRYLSYPDMIFKLS